MTTRYRARRHAPGYFKFHQKPKARLPGRATKGFRKTKTATHTKTMTKRINGPKLRRDGPVSESLVVYPYKKQVRLPKGVKVILGEQYMVNNDISRLNHSANSQGVTTLPGIYNALDISNMMTQAASIVTSSGANNNWKILLESVNAHTLITNQTNDVVRITLYDCVPRRDNNNSSYTPPNNAWQTGDTAANGNGAAVNYIGSTPFQTPAFTRLYRVVKVTTLDLHTGGHHIHRVEGKPMLSFDRQTSVELGNSVNSGFRNLTGFTMVVTHGYPVNDVSVKANVGTAAGSIDFVITRQYRFRVLESSVASLLQVASNLVSVTTPGIISDLIGSTSTTLVI